jgi:protein SCO1/2
MHKYYLKRSIQLLFIAAHLLTAINGCNTNLPVIDNLDKLNFILIDQSGKTVNFPNDFKGKTLAVGYIFTNCPDICPLTTNNMRLVQESLTKEVSANIEFISISFDPLIDTPEVLTKFAEIRNLDLTNWTFLTGRQKTIDSLMKEIGILAVVGDSTITSAGEVINYYVHTDRISLIDSELNIRKNYIGSKVVIKEIVNDIISLN